MDLQELWKAEGVSGKFGREPEWSWVSFYHQVADSVGPDGLHTVRMILNWAKRSGLAIQQASSSMHTAFFLTMRYNGETHTLVGMRSDGTLCLAFRWMKYPFNSVERKREFIQAFNKEANLLIPSCAFDKIYEKEAPLLSFRNQHRISLVEGFLRVLDWYVYETKSA